MSRTVVISEALASVLEQRRAKSGYASLDAAAEAVLARGLAAERDDDLSAYSADELCALLDEAEASGAEAPWDAASVRAEVKARFAERVRQT